MAVWEVGNSRHNDPPIEGPLQPLDTHTVRDVKGFRAILWAPVMLRGTSLSNSCKHDHGRNFIQACLLKGSYLGGFFRNFFVKDDRIESTGESIQIKARLLKCKIYICIKPKTYNQSNISFTPKTETLCENTIILYEFFVHATVRIFSWTLNAGIKFKYN